MSEFTSGHLFLSKNLETIKLNTQEEDIILKLNDKWCVYLYQGGDYFDEESDSKASSLSNKCPILYFYNGEDHGWGYKIYKDDHCISELNINYGKLHDDTMEILQTNSKFKIEDLLIGEVQKLYQEAQNQVIRSDTYRDYVEELFRLNKVDEFNLFEIKKEKIDELRIVLDSDYLLSLDYIQELVQSFKELIDIVEMEWVSYNYAEYFNNKRIL